MQRMYLCLVYVPYSHVRRELGDSGLFAFAWRLERQFSPFVAYSLSLSKKELSNTRDFDGEPCTFCRRLLQLAYAMISRTEHP